MNKFNEAREQIQSIPDTNSNGISLSDLLTEIKVKIYEM